MIRQLRYGLLSVLAIILCVLVLPMAGQALQPPVVQTIQAVSQSSRPTKTLVEQGRSRYDSGQFREAIEILQQAVQQSQSEGNGLQQAIALSNLALVQQKMGRLQTARQTIDRSLTLLDQLTESRDRQIIFAQSLEIQGSLQLEQGQAESALTSWRSAANQYDKLEDSAGVVRSQINQAQALQILGFYRRALDLLMSLDQQLQSQMDTVTKVVQLRSLGNAFQLANDLARSQQVLSRSLAMAQRLQQPEEASATQLSLGNLARTKQDLEQAIAYYQQASTSSVLLTRLQARINWFDLLQAHRSKPVPAQLLSQISTELNQLPLNQSSLYTKVHFAQSLMQAVGTTGGEPLAIAQLLARTAQQAEQLGDIRAESYVLGTFGNLYERTAQWAEAQRLTEKALRLTQMELLPDVDYRWHWQLGRLLKRQQQIPAARLEYDAAIADLQTIRNDLVVVNRELQFSFRDSVEPIYRESVELLLEQPDGTGDVLDAQILDTARQRIEALQLAELDNFFRQACLNATPVILDKVVDQENPTAAILYPILLPKQLHLIVKLPGQALRHYKVNHSQSEVEAVAKQLRIDVEEPDRILSLKKSAQQLHQWLISPVEADLKQNRVDSLVFILDAALRNIPLAALYDGNQYLVEKYAIALSPGLTLLNPQPLVPSELRVLAAGLVDPPPGFAYLSTLPAIPSEFAQIKTSGVATTQLLGQQFTSQTLGNQINQTPFNVVHLATHGQFSSEAEKTYVLAADGPINVTQFDTLLRRQNSDQVKSIELLVLSACQTAAGDNRATLGLAGVAVRAGARSTLASLWNIQDSATPILIGEFYKELANSKVSKAEALRRSQVKLLKEYPNYARPSYWAAYVLIGNWL